MDVRSLGVFCGTGTVENLRIENGGILRAECNGGKLTATGDVAMKKGAVLEIPVSGTSNGCLDFVSSDSHAYTAESNVVLRVVGLADHLGGNLKIMDWSQTTAAKPPSRRRRSTSPNGNWNTG